MAGSGSDPPPGMDPLSSNLVALLNRAQAFIDGEVTTSDQHVEMREPGTSGASTDRANETVEPVGTGEDSDADIHDDTHPDEGILFRNFKHLPLEIRSKIWVAAAEAVRPCGIYHFTFKSLSVREVKDTVRKVSDIAVAKRDRIEDRRALSLLLEGLMLEAYRGGRIQTFTPSSAVAKMTRAIRDLFRSCPEARAELMRCPKLSSSFDFYYLKGVKCNLGTIRPFFYDTDWVTMDGLNLDHDPSVFLTDLGTRDIKRIQHFALPYDGFDRTELFDRGSLTSSGGCRKSLHIFRWLDGLKSVGLYAPSVTIKRMRNWARLITENDRLFLKRFPPPKTSRASTPSWNAQGYDEAMENVCHLVGLMGHMEAQKTKERWPATTCDFAALQFCFIVHANKQKGLDLMKFKEDGSHLDGVKLDDLGKIGKNLKWLPRAGDYFR